MSSMSEQDYADQEARTATTPEAQIEILADGDSFQKEAVLGRRDLPLQTLAYIAHNMRLTRSGMSGFLQQANVTPELITAAQDGMI
jgi:hypothetical protein